VLDLRYNGGGYLFIASELAYMIAGPNRTGGRVFERLSYNSKRTAETEDTPFFDTSCIYDGSRCTSSQPLPTLNLGRVYVLTQKGSCSASESVINGLRGVDVEVIQIGGQTCGKPYGFTAKNNCGISYFPIEFVGVNAKGFGDYADGFVPSGLASGGGRKLPGCELADDFNHALSDPAERMLAAALSYRSSGQCPPKLGLVQPQAAFSSEGAVPLQLRRSPVRGNRIVGGR
jgi:carboxyl-terminal processing protease